MTPRSLVVSFQELFVFIADTTSREAASGRRRETAASNQSNIANDKVTQEVQNCLVPVVAKPDAQRRGVQGNILSDTCKLSEVFKFGQTRKVGSIICYGVRLTTPKYCSMVTPRAFQCGKRFCRCLYVRLDMIRPSPVSAVCHRRSQAHGEGRFLNVSDKNLSELQDFRGRPLLRALAMQLCLQTLSLASYLVERETF